MFGTQTGNCEGLAEQMMEKCGAAGIPASIKDIGDYKPNKFRDERNMVVIVSTHGEGDPPDTVLGMYELLHGKRAPKLKDLHFSVLALGDSSYEQFCQTGRDFDAVFETLGGIRLVDRVDCDLDYEDAAEAWMDTCVEAFKDKVSAGRGGGTTPAMAFPKFGTRPKSQYNKKNPFPATMLENLVLNGRGSDKETRHIELSLEGSDLTYEPGDVVYVKPTNNPAYVDELMAALGFNGSGTEEVRHQFLHDLEITTLTRPTVEKYGVLTGSKDLAELVQPDNKEKLLKYLHGREVIDMVQDYPAKRLEQEAFIKTLRKLPPRAYSIASSYKAHPEEVHLTVVAVRYESHGRKREGVCSTWFSERLDEDATVPVYLQANKHFRLPADPSLPIIMVGPGTGVAPFRAFVEERQEIGAPGKNWLFFGDQHFMTDFLYQVEWQQFIKDGVLTHLDVAFSRDQEYKIYVQDRIREKGAEIWRWLEDGAYFYVCGDEKQMAPDVHEALIQVAEEQGGKSRKNAEAYVKQMQNNKRYLRDVY